jgi:hypothetical protein
MIKQGKITQTQVAWILAGFTGAVILTGIFSIGALAMVGIIPSPFSSLGGAPVNPAPSTPTFIPARLGGVVWHDMCVSEAARQDFIPQGCLPENDGGTVSANSTREVGEPGIGGVEITLGAGVCPSQGLQVMKTNSEGLFVFDAPSPGTYCLSIDPRAGANPGVLQSGRWTAPISDAGAAYWTVTVTQGQQVLDLDFGWDFRDLPFPDPTPMPSPTYGPTGVQPTSAGCVDKAGFVEDVTVPDNTRIEAGKSFEKIWRLKNMGTCTWTNAYSLTFTRGDRMGASSPIALTGNIAPGTSVDLKVQMTAPVQNGTYRGEWKLANANGAQFGIGENAANPFWVQIIVGTSGSGGSFTWRGEYFSNRKLEGQPALVRNDPAIDFKWKKSAPDESLPSDNFSVRWKGRAEFGSGIYRFKVLVDDGARLWVDKYLVIDSWKDGAEREVTVDVSMAKGPHDIQLEYYERSGEARVRLNWEKISSPTFSDWKGEYWVNATLTGDPLFLRNDKKIDFDWGAGSPTSGIPVDDFSARWTRKVTFEAGIVRFSARSDDGVRVFLDGKRIVNEWHPSSGTTVYTTDRSLAAGEHKLVVEYYEHAGKARVAFWWEMLNPTPTATASATATPTATEEPPVIDTPVPTDTSTAPSPAEPQLIYDLSRDFCVAEWRSSSGTLACPGEAAAAQGSVLKEMAMLLEDGTEASKPVLVLFPENVDRGWIEGRYPAFTVQPGDRFRTIISCRPSLTDCDVGVELNYQAAGGDRHNIAAWRERYDGNVRQLEVDLSSLSGKSVQLILTVYGEQASPHNQLIWVQPGVWR